MGSWPDISVWPTIFGELLPQSQRTLQRDMLSRPHLNSYGVFGLHKHLELASAMELIGDEDAKRAMQLCARVIGLLIGLVRRLGCRREGRSTLPPSPFP